MSKIAFIYPGQGAQKAGMGKDFYENSPLAAKLYDQASQAPVSYTHLDVYKRQCIYYIGSGDTG